MHMYQGQIPLCNITVFIKNIPVAGTNFCPCNILCEIQLACQNLCFKKQGQNDFSSMLRSVSHANCPHCQLGKEPINLLFVIK